jgi:glyoxylase-like metal-dependent hydrolase (beta-lactamase superfamily II)
MAPVLPDRDLHAGDLVESALGPWRVVETPGHAPSHICLWPPQAELLLTGDLVTSTYAPYMDYGYSPDPVS